MNIKLKPDESEGNVEVAEYCKICNVKEHKYVCPRCNIMYCSVSCYKSPYHLDCSEAFYKESVEKAIEAEDPDPNSKKSMEEILKRLYEEEREFPLDNLNEDFDEEEVDDDDDGGLSMAERLQGIDLDNADAVWSKLSDSEKKEFAELVKHGDATSLVPPWEAWWSEKHSKPKVKFVDQESEPEPYKDLCPKHRTVPSLGTLTNKPSPLVLFNIANTIGGYALIIRYYNGNFTTLELEAASMLIEVSKALGANQNFPSLELALASVAQTVTDSPWLNLPADAISTMKKDAIKILEGPNTEEPEYYVRSALVDIRDLLIKAKKLKTGIQPKSGFSCSFPESSENSIGSVSKDCLKKCIKKIEFYESWCVEFYRNNLKAQLSNDCT